MGKSDENFEFLFVIFTLGTLLAPSARIYISDCVLKLMIVTKDAVGEFDWCSFIFKGLCYEIREFKRDLLKGNGKGRKTVEGCIYFLVVSG